MTDQQSCGACKWLRIRSSTGIVGDCVYPLPAIPLSVGVEWSQMYKSDGRLCACFERKEAGDEA